jgi:hypothetical protein
MSPTEVMPPLKQRYPTIFLEVMVMAKNGQQSTKNNTRDNANKPKKQGEPAKAKDYKKGTIPARAVLRLHASEENAVAHQ